jgi:O-antigen/teichoic acid export membrane protein
VIAASSALTLIISQVDKLVLARVFTLKQFGIYAIGANLAAAVSSIALRYVQRIVYPALAATWRAEPEAMKQRYYELRGLLFYTYLFGGGVLIGSAPLVVRILYDPRYAFAGIYLRLLAITATLVIVTTSANEALVAMGRTSTTLITNVIRIFWLVPVGIGAFLVAGPIGLIVALSLIELPAYAYTSWVLNKHELFSPAKEMRSWSLIMAGVGVGFAADALGKLILPL